MLCSLGMVVVFGLRSCCCFVCGWWVVRSLRFSFWLLRYFYMRFGGDDWLCDLEMLC